MNQLPSLMILGTDTGVGKTVVTALLAKIYRERGVSAIPFKPVATGAIAGDGGAIWTDSAFLAAVARVAPDDVRLYQFKRPLSPHLAAGAEGMAIDLQVVVDRFETLGERYDAILVEGVGGCMTPLGADRNWLDLAALLALPIVIVARAGLGTLNHTLLTVHACRDRGLTVAGLVVNRLPDRPNEAETTNPAELERLTGIPLLGILPELDLSVDEARPGRLDDALGALDLSKLDGLKRDWQPAIDADMNHVWHPFTPMLEYLSETPHPLMIVGADDCYLEDSDGRRYIDGVSSLWVNVHGHKKRELDESVKAQLSKVAHTTLLGLANEPSALLAAELAKISPGGLNRVFYSDNGSTAVEVALKVAFQYWRQAGRPEKQEFVTFVNAYHGDTLGAVSVGGHDLFHAMFKPLLFKTHAAPAAYCYRCPIGAAYPGCNLGCLDRLEEILIARGDRVAAVIAEPKVQGAAGILVQPPGYLTRIRDLCSKYGVLLIADEVATGFGRTGELFACRHEDIRPDIMCLAKGITGGYLPLAATLFREEIYEAFLGPYEESKTFFHGHTYTGNPLACATALANLELLRGDGWFEAVREKSEALGEYLRPLSDLEHVGDVRRCGLMVGIELVADKNSAELFPVKARVGRKVTLKARERAVIIRPLGDVVVLMPPLTIALPELKKLVAETAWAISETTGSSHG